MVFNVDVEDEASVFRVYSFSAVTPVAMLPAYLTLLLRPVCVVKSPSVICPPCLFTSISIYGPRYRLPV